MNQDQDEIDTISAQEERIRLSRFDHEIGIQIGQTLLREAQHRSLAVTIDVFAFGQVIFHSSMPGTVPDNDRWVERKRAVVLRFNKSSLRVGRELKVAGQTIEERYYVDSKTFSAHGGSFPLRLFGSDGVIGAVTVSGLPQEDDHALVVSVLERFIGDGASVGEQR